MLTIMYYELVRMLRSRETILLNMALPLLLILILGTALSNAFQVEDQNINPVRTAIYIEDAEAGAETGAGAGAGAEQQAFRDFLSSENIEPYITPTEVNSRTDVEAMIRSGDADYGLIIPRGFNEAVYAGQAAQLELIPGSNELLNITANMLMNSFVQQVNRAQAEAIVLGPLADSSAQQINSPELLNQPSTIIGSFQQQATTSAVQYYSISMMIMFLLYAGMGCAISLTTEGENHTLSRLNSMPLTSVDIIGGKLLGNLIVSTIQATIIIVFSAYAYGVDWGPNKLIVVAICLLTIMAAMSLALLLAVLFKTTKSVTAIFQTIIIASTFLSGGMAVGLGDLISQIGKFSINHWAATGLLNNMLNSELSIILQDIGVLGAIASGLFLAAIVSYRKVGYHE